MVASTQKSGLIVASFGRQTIVEINTSHRYHCIIKGRKIRPVCGDKVQWKPIQDDQVDGIVVAIEPRSNELRRPTRRGKSEIVAANIYQLLVVFADQPDADPFLIDRYVAAAEHLGVNCVLVKNKVDLSNKRFPWLDQLSSLGYPIVMTSAKTGEGLESLKQQCLSGNSILVGQSGVGKSSLLNSLIPGVRQQTQAVSQSGKFGRHTTSASYLYPLNSIGSAALIDSPGVRDFAPPPLDEDQVVNGYRELAARASACKFSNCRHEKEPSCAVKTGVKNKTIDQRRYQSYLKLLKLMRELRRAQSL